MCRFWDISLMICFSVSVMFVGGDNISELPPPKNLTFIWETPFRLSLTWEKPEDLDRSCTVNYTVNVYHSQNCSGESDSRRVQTLGCKLNISNENGLCISVTTNPENCENRTPNNQPTTINIAPPSVRLVKNRGYGYSHSKMNCTWTPVTDVQDLSLYYWLPRYESVKKCIPDETLKPRGCIIQDAFLKDTLDIFYLFNGTYNGTSVINTFKDECPTKYVKLNKPQLAVHKKNQNLIFQVNGSDLDEFAKECYSYNYTISKCNQFNSFTKKHFYEEQYDPACKYRARVQINFSQNCGAGKSDLSDEVEYGEDSDSKLPALLAVIIIPLIVSFCMLVSLVLLRRHKDIIFPKIPEPSLLFKDMLINNIRTPEEIQTPATGRLYIPLEEVVESKISLEPDTLFVPLMKNEPK